MAELFYEKEILLKFTLQTDGRGESIQFVRLISWLTLGCCYLMDKLLE
jgi:hypothetical protein